MGCLAVAALASIGTGDTHNSAVFSTGTIPLTCREAIERIVSRFVQETGAVPSALRTSVRLDLVHVSFAQTRRRQTPLGRTAATTTFRIGQPAG